MGNRENQTGIRFEPHQPALPQTAIWWKRRNRPKRAPKMLQRPWQQPRRQTVQCPDLQPTQAPLPASWIALWLTFARRSSKRLPRSWRGNNTPLIPDVRVLRSAFCCALGVSSYHNLSDVGRSPDPVLLERPNQAWKIVPGTVIYPSSTIENMQPVLTVAILR